MKTLIALSLLFLAACTPKFLYYKPDTMTHEQYSVAAYECNRDLRMVLAGMPQQPGFVRGPINFYNQCMASKGIRAVEQ